MKLVNEKGQELGMSKETNLLTTSPIFRSVRHIASELIVETFHATLQLSIELYGDGMWSTNVAAGNQ